jgi:cobalt-zinc-cadmium efflux system outer membrane protein
MSPELQDENAAQVQAAPPDGGSMTLGQFEQLALSNNPTIAQASSNVDKAVGLLDQVGRSPNPTVGYFGSQIADAGTDQHGLFVEQEFVRGNKLALNRQVMNRSLDAQMADVETQRIRVLTDVGTRFYAALAAQRQIDLTNSFMTLSMKSVQIAEQRKEALEGSQTELLQAQIQLNEVELSRQQAEFAFLGAFRDLAATAGTPDMQPTVLAGDLDLRTQAINWDDTYRGMLANSPELVAAHSRVQQAGANLNREQVQTIPNATVQLGAGVDNATGSGLLNIQLSSPIPVFNGNVGNISAARADYNRAVNEVLRIELSIKSRLAKVSQEFDISLATVRKMENEILPKAQDTLTLAETAYAKGEFDFLQVFIIRRTFFDSNLRYVRALGDLAQAQLRIDGLLLDGGLDARNEFFGDDGLRGKAFSQQ